MVELHDRHTATNLKDEVYQKLAELNIDINQVYSVTVDNGRNMVKMVHLMEKDTTEDIEQYLDSSVDGSMQKTDEETPNGVDGLEDYDDTMEGFLNDLNDLICGHQVACIRCGAHTVQLVVSDVCKDEVHQRNIKAITKIVVAFHNTKYKNFFEVSGGKYPSIPGPTRWNSNFLMQQSLLNSKDFFERLGCEYAELGKLSCFLFISLLLYLSVLIKIVLCFRRSNNILGIHWIICDGVRTTI